MPLIKTLSQALKMDKENDIMSKKGYSRPGLFGSINHYDEKEHKRGHSNPGFLGGFNHYDD